MRAISIEIETKAPTLVAALPPASNLIQTLTCIPGNTLRGALAQEYLSGGKSPSTDEFRRIFLAGEVRFCFAFIGGADPIPLSARSCKYAGGFRHDNGHGVIDLLLSGEEERGCPDCGHTVDYLHGYWLTPPHSGVGVTTRLITRTAIDATRATARSGQLFSQRVLNEGQIFSGRIEGPEDLLIVLEALVAKPLGARVGGGSSRGQGWVEIRRSTAPQRQWQPAAERFAQYPQRSDRPLLAVTLLSDGLFHDCYLRDRSAPTIEHLAPLGVDPIEWKPSPIKAYMDTRVVFGFDGEPICLPRQPRIAVAAGSAFLFEARDGCARPTIPTGDGIGWIGDGAGEGYGYAALWYPFHLRPEPGADPGVNENHWRCAEDELIRHAEALSGLGFNAISASQMAAVDDQIRRGRSFKDTVAAVEGFLQRQIEKAMQKADRRGCPQGSWAAPPRHGNETQTLGGTLVHYMTGQAYLSSPVPAADQLAMLQRFWQRFYGFYRYHAATKKDLRIRTIAKEDESS